LRWISQTTVVWYLVATEVRVSFGPVVMNS